MRPVRAAPCSLVATMAIACSEVAGPTLDAGLADAPIVACALRFVPSETLVTQTRARVDLTVRATSAPPNTSVRFALLGDAADGSLADTERPLQSDGSATMELLAPSSAATFQVRATARCGAETVREVRVGSRGNGTLTVTAIYRGARMPDGLSVAVARATDCDLALGAQEIATTRIPVPGGTLRFSELPAEVDLIVRGRAEGRDGGVLATGCGGPFRVLRERATPVDLLFLDANLVLGDRYDLELFYDLSAVASASILRWNEITAVEISRRGGEIAILGAALSDAVFAAAPTASQAAARADFDRGWRDSISAQVSQNLARRDAPVTTSLRRVAEGVAAAVASIRYVGTLRRSGERWSCADLSALIDPGTPDVLRDDAQVMLAEPREVRVTTSTSDGVTAVFEGLPLPYSRLARRGLDALTARLGVSSAAEFASLAACPVVVSAVRGSAGPCDDRCASEACRRAIVPLGTMLETAIASIDERRATVSLRFTGPGRPRAGGLEVVRASGIAFGTFVEDPGASVVGTVNIQSPIQ